MTDFLLYWAARMLIALIQKLPLPAVARLGRFGGHLVYWFDLRHRRVALQNLTLCFDQYAPARIRAIARENFKRIGENFAGAIKTASLSHEQIGACLRFIDTAKLLSPLRSRVIALGHFGNFELYARYTEFVPEFTGVTTYRGLRQPAINRLMQDLRSRARARFFERRSEADALKAAMREPNVLLGLLADQNAGRRGLRLPFLGHDCSTSPAPAIFALRYGCALHTAICYRVGLGQWQIELSDEIPTHEDGHPRSVEEITRDINRAFETAVLRDPPNWFWVHNRWKAHATRQSQHPA